MSLDAHPVAFPSLGKVKMEDRKRSIAPDQEDLGPPAKRQAVTSGPNGARAHTDADLPWNDEIQVRRPIPSFVPDND
jgi:E3 ubiquitin-protein ligase BRE1